VDHRHAGVARVERIRGATVAVHVIEPASGAGAPARIAISVLLPALF
jgi:hypothetical protein